MISTQQPFLPRLKATAFVATTLALAACGGGSDSDLSLSANQQTYESVALADNAGGAYRLRWNLASSGPQVGGTNFVYSESLVLANTPLTGGPQQARDSDPRNLSKTLALPAEKPVSVLKGGVVRVVPGSGKASITSYTGSDVKVETLASDGTVAYAEVRSDISFTALTGSLVSAPSEFKEWFHAFFANPGILSEGFVYRTGSGYLKYTATNQGDRYEVFDCQGATTDANVTPCATSTTLSGALSAGLLSNSDGATYHLADGSMQMVDGLKVWVAGTPRPQAATLTSTAQYRVYFELNGNVYTGALTKDGATLGGSYYVATPGAPGATGMVFLPYQIRLNQAAHASIADALAI